MPYPTSIPRLVLRQGLSAGPPPPTLCLQPMYTKKEKLNILDRLAWSEMFETFLAKK